MKLTLEQIYKATPGQLESFRNTLVIDKMKMDKFFTIFLDNAEMDNDNTSTPEWITYREMLKEYGRINDRIKTINCRLGIYA